MKALDQIRKAVRDKYAWPGGYPLAILMADGETICCNCARKEWRQIVAAKMHPGTSRDWQPVAAFINWEDETLRCAHCDKLIESAYGQEVDAAQWHETCEGQKRAESGSSGY